MDSAFVQRVIIGLNNGTSKLALHDRVSIFCIDGLRVDGEVIGFCPEALLLACDNAEAWVNASAIIMIAKANQGDDGNECAARIPKVPSARRLPASNGLDINNKVYCDVRNESA